MALTIPNRDPSEAWATCRQMLRAGKDIALQVKNASAAGPISSDQVLRLTTMCADVDAQVVITAAVPGITAYIRNQLDNQSLDVAAELTAIRTALANVIAEVVTNFPAANGFLQAVQLQASGRYTWRTLSTAQTAGLRTQIDALLAALP